MNLIQEINLVCDPEFPVIMIGSRSLDNCVENYRVSRDKSDYDFIVSIKKWNEIMSVVNKHVYVDEVEAGPAIKESNYNKGIKFHVKPKLEKFEINLIPLHENEYQVWKQAQVALIALAKSDKDFRDNLYRKERRVAIYEQLRSVYKMAVT